jgi:hypothetical protein
MGNPVSIAVIFIAISVIFICVAFRDFLKAEGKMTIARRTWIRMALIFAGVGIGIYIFMHVYGCDAILSNVQAIAGVSNR